MARKLTYNINRFDGGMTDAIRDTSNPTKFAYISHFDIYRDPNLMYVMPGYVDDMSIGGDADGMKVYDIRAISYLSAQVWAVGTKSDGTGSKLFNKADPTTAEWDDTPFGAVIEGTDDLADFTYLTGQNNDFAYIYWNTTASGTSYITQYDATGPTVNDKHVNLGGSNTTNPMVVETFYNGNVYGNEGGSGGLTVFGATATKDTKTTAIFVKDVQSGNESVGIFGNPTGEQRSRLLLWDAASLLVDQNIEFGKGRPVALGFPSNFWVGVINEGIGTNDQLLSEANNLPSFSVKVASGSTAQKIYRFYGKSSTNGVMLPTRSSYLDAMLWYAKVASNTDADEFTEGVFACGKQGADSPLAISVLFDTSSLGEVRHVRSIGNHYYFIHGGDGSISRLDSFDTGTYDVPATIETLVYGAQSPYQKELNGISVVTENLPASASVKVDYRTDVDSAWTELGTSNTMGKQKHQFTRASGTPIGKFQEIQFRITCTGKIVLKNIKIDITETDDLAF